MKLSNTIDLVRANYRKEGHSDKLRLALLDNGDSGKQFSVLVTWLASPPLGYMQEYTSAYTRESLLNGLQEKEIDIIDNLQVSRKQVLHKSNRPFLQCLRKHRVVGISKCPSNDCKTRVSSPPSLFLHNSQHPKLTGPTLIPCQALNIDQYSLKLYNCECRMGIIQLNCNLVWELSPWPVRLLEPPNNVVQRGCHPEILLLQSVPRISMVNPFYACKWIALPQLLSGINIIIWI